VLVSGVDQIPRSHGRSTIPGCMKRLLDKHTTDGGVLPKYDGNPLGHPLFHRLVSIHGRLLVDDDLCRVDFCRLTSELP
jgi:hypothetical protein